MKRILLLLLFLIQFAFPALTWAQCSVTRILQTKTIVLSGGPITVGSDLPNGSIIYRGIISAQFDPDGSGAYSCIIPATFLPPLHIQLYTILTNATPLGGGVYATGFPGVGIRIFNSVEGGDVTTPLSVGAGTFLRDRQYPLGNCTAGLVCLVAVAQAFRFELIKIGDIMAGTIMGVNLPHISTFLVSLTPTSPIVGSGITINLAFSGGIVIQSGTCTTGDYSIGLGDYTVAELSAVNETSWVVANINLSNCPIFTGMGNTSSNLYFGWSLPSTIGTYNNNVFKVTLMPINAIRNGVDGAFLIDQSADSASGVDIQIHRGSVAIHSPVVFDQPYDVAVPLGSSGNISIGLIARYIRNNDALHPGKIIGKVLFLIHYN